jgi:2-polyprenyl-3-methyl-5-hydroxy-6-metoxy-1,4-benzoquinol methylase
MRRVLTPELMDDPTLDAREHGRALRGLARLNRVARSDAILWPEVRRLAAECAGPLRLLDVATGSGDVPIALARRAARGGLALEVSACDVSRVALEHAERRAAAAGVALRLWRHDVVWGVIPREYDIVTCSLVQLRLVVVEAALLLGY